MKSLTQCKVISGVIFYVVYVAVMLYAHGFTGWALLRNVAPAIAIAIFFLIAWSLEREIKKIEEEIEREEA